MALALRQMKHGDRLEVVNGLTRTQDAWTVEDASHGLLKFRSDAGATVTRASTWCSPALEWNDGGEKGTSVVDWELGSLWPLAVGNSAYFHRIITLSDGRRREENWRCRVESQTKVKLASSGQEYDAFKVVCITETNIHTWYWAADVAGPVQYTRTSAANGEVLDVIERAGLVG